jgi:hypothetical protein
VALFAADQEAPERPAPPDAVAFPARPGQVGKVGRETLARVNHLQGRTAGGGEHGLDPGHGGDKQPDILARVGAHSAGDQKVALHVDDHDRAVPRVEAVATFGPAGDLDHPAIIPLLCTAAVRRP